MEMHCFHIHVHCCQNAIPQIRLWRITFHLALDLEAANESEVIKITLTVFELYYVVIFEKADDGVLSIFTYYISSNQLLQVTILGFVQTVAI